MVLSADLAWFSAIGILAAYELWAILTHHITLSRAVWTAEREQYGALLPFLVGFLAAHFVWCGK